MLIYLFTSRMCKRTCLSLFGGVLSQVWRGEWLGCLGFFPSQKLSTKMFEVLKKAHIVPAPKGLCSHGCLFGIWHLPPSSHRWVGRGDHRVAEEKRKSQSRGKHFKG